MFQRIIKEMRRHLPFTIFGGMTGILIMFVFQGISNKTAYDIFYVLHPLHVVLSALVTASMYHRHKCGECGEKCQIHMLLFIGYIGSIGIATLSDCIIPYLGETLLDMPHRHVHIGFIEKWWLVNPLAILGVFIAYHWPSTKFPHAGHVLLSTWATLFHILMASNGSGGGIFMYSVIFIFLFLAVWIPCCVSDIIFPLLFVKDKDIASRQRQTGK